MFNYFTSILSALQSYRTAHAGLSPDAIVVGERVFEMLKEEAKLVSNLYIWKDDEFENVPLIIDEYETLWHFEGSVPALKHHTCPLCGWTDRKENFSHRIDYVDICDHCFENIYSHKNVDVDWRKQVNEHNNVVRNEMDENYLKTYGEILFGEKE